MGKLTQQLTLSCLAQHDNLAHFLIIGSTASKENQAAAAVGVCEICSIAASSVQCSNEIHVQRGLWQKWKDFNDRFDYYIYRLKLHSVICIQRQDTKAALAIDLVVKQNTKKWYIRVREVEWKPGNWKVHKSKHAWHAAAALKAVQSYTVDFDKWNIVNNCGTFVKGVIERMADAEKRASYECEHITDDFDKLSSFGASLGVEVTFLTSKEAVEPIPPQEEGEEEDINDGPINQEDFVERSDTAYREDNSKDAMDNGTTHTDEETTDVGTEGVRLNAWQTEKYNESLKKTEEANNE